MFTDWSKIKLQNINKKSENIPKWLEIHQYFSKICASTYMCTSIYTNKAYDVVLK